MTTNRQLPEPISNLWVSLQKITLLQHPNQCQLNKRILSFEKELIKLFQSWFPDHSGFSDSQMADYLFVRVFHIAQAKTVFKALFSGLIDTTKRLRKSIYHRWTKDGFGQRVLDDIRLLKEIAFETAPFLDLAEFWVNKNQVYSGRCKRNVLFSTEIFECSKMVLREAHYKSTLGDFVMRPTSIFLIRQAIEIRLKNALGINMIRQLNGRIIKIPFSRLLENLFKKNKEAIHLPVPLPTIKRIYDWSNFYIHSGWMPYIWEVECAHHLLNPMFVGKRHRDGSWSLFGTVRIKKKTYDDIPNLLINILKKDNPNIVAKVIRFEKPECVII
jgi:hypothetical protein